MTGLQFSLFKESFFLKTTVISISFKLSKKLPVIRHSLKRQFKVFTKVLQLNFNILAGVFFLVVTFLRFMF